MNSATLSISGKIVACVSPSDSSCLRMKAFLLVSTSNLFDAAAARNPCGTDAGSVLRPCMPNNRKAPSCLITRALSSFGLTHTTDSK